MNHDFVLRMRNMLRVRNNRQPTLDMLRDLRSERFNRERRQACRDSLPFLLLVRRGMPPMGEFMSLFISAEVTESRAFKFPVDILGRSNSPGATCHVHEYPINGISFITVMAHRPRPVQCIALTFESTRP
jgi:hypothetical protein